MTVPFDIKVPGFSDITVDAYGDIEVSVCGGYHGEDVERTFDAATMREIADFAEKHKRAYDAWKDSDYEDETAYFKIMETE